MSRQESGQESFGDQHGESSRATRIKRLRRQNEIFESLRHKEIVRAQEFFAEVADGKTFPNTSIFLVTHLVPGRAETFIHSLSQIASIAGILPKPKTADKQEVENLKQKHEIVWWQRKDAGNTALVVPKFKDLLKTRKQKIVLLDMGGYFAPNLNELSEALGGRLKGVVEDTENGLQNYMELSEVPCPVFQIARSPLKEPEDYLVGQSLVFSAEALLRQLGIVLTNQNILILGYGKIGHSIAETLGRSNVRTMIYDIDPIRHLQARGHGFETPPKDTGLEKADLIFSATGRKGLKEEDFPKLKKGAFVATVTSADDELDIEGLSKTYQARPVTQNVEQYSSRTTDHYLYLMNQGNAVNFVHQAVLGPYIYLAQGEILRAFQLAARSGLPNTILEVPKQERQRIATLWMDKFNEGHYSPTTAT